jgi:hypothetical protein
MNGPTGDVADMTELPFLPADDEPRARVLGTVIVKGGGEKLLIPEEELRRVDAMGDGPDCEQCGAPFEPRRGSGGKAQKFCSTECRMAFHSRTPERPVGQRRPTSTLGIELPASRPKPNCNDTGPYAGPSGSGPAERDFEWDADNVDIVIQHQPRTAIYLNPYNAVVIRQEGGPLEEDDPFLLFTADNLPALIRNLQAWQRKLSGGAS